VPDQRFRSRCLSLIGSLPIPEPFTLERFREGLERHRGRRLMLVPTPTATNCSGVWVGTEEADYIFYARDTTLLHQWHIVAHETGHMVLGHQGAPIRDDEFARMLFPHLSPDLVRSALARAGYSDPEEREAETFASLLLDRVSAPVPAPGLAPGQAQLLSRIEGAFTTARPAHWGVSR
jgi:hypothetical protein